MGMQNRHPEPKASNRADGTQMAGMNVQGAGREFSERKIKAAAAVNLQVVARSRLTRHSPGAARSAKYITDRLMETYSDETR